LNSIGEECSDLGHRTTKWSTPCDANLSTVTCVSQLIILQNLGTKVKHLINIYQTLSSIL